MNVLLERAIQTSDHRVREEITRLRAENEALRKNAERLDWLNEAFFHRKWNGVVGSGESYVWGIHGDYRHVLHHLTKHDFREAIDFAMRKEDASDKT